MGRIGRVGSYSCDVSFVDGREAREPSSDSSGIVAWSRRGKLGFVVVVEDAGDALGRVLASLEGGRPVGDVGAALEVPGWELGGA